ncbi:MAG: hypothetical protein ABII64_00020 [Elusimicrobiota bacterium]
MFKNTLIIQALLLSILVSAVFAEGGTIDIQGLERIQPETQEQPVAGSEPAQYYRRPLPVYISELSNINDYTLFANGGWDGNWYVGYNACWMEEIPQPPDGEYRKAYIGVKLGRMKTRRVTGKPSWEKEAIPGVVYGALSSTPAWKSNQQYFLAASEDISLESDPENAIEGVGESRWFWAEVPLEKVNMSGPNYVAVWSPTEFFVSVASSPILAAGWGSKKANSWITNDIKGYPPLTSVEALKTPITIFEPAIAMKLVPIGTEQEIAVSISAIKEGRDKTSNKTFIADVSGEGIEKAWLEMTIDGKKWERNGRTIYSAPYVLTLIGDKMPEGKNQIRVAVSDIWGNIGYSEPAEILVTRTQGK